MALIGSFRELKVYRMVLSEATRIYHLTRLFPREEQYALTDQIRRSSRAVGALLAEGWARRRYRAAFVNKVNEALGEALETQAWLDHALMCGYIDQKTYHKHDTIWQQIGAKLNRMIQRADSFCLS